MLDLVGFCFADKSMYVARYVVVSPEIQISALHCILNMCRTSIDLVSELDYNNITVDDPGDKMNKHKVSSPSYLCRNLIWLVAN